MMIRVGTIKLRRQELTPATTIAVAWASAALVACMVVGVFGVYLLAISLLELTRGEVGLTRVAVAVAGLVVGPIGLHRYWRTLREAVWEGEIKVARTAMKTDLIQLFLIFVLLTVLFPVVWILSMSLDPRDFSRPQGLSIIPPGASLQAYRKVLTHPSPNPVTFLELLRNSLFVAGGTALFSVALGTSAAYAFSRFKFPGRQIGMLGFVMVLMIPAGATLAPLFVLLNLLRLRTTLVGLAIAYASTALPFAIWNMKGFIDTLPHELEEAALIDGCSPTQAFLRVTLPLAVPGLAVTALWGFLTGWSEFILAWTFLVNPKTFTLPMVLRGMVGQYAAGTPWAEFSAMAMVMSIPPVIIFYLLQRYLVAGLAIGAVKG